jgi:membrane-associated protein
MNYYKFLSANALGALLWGVGITLASFYSGSISWVRNISYLLATIFIIGSVVSIRANNIEHP